MIRTERVVARVTPGMKRFLRLQAASFDNMTVSTYLSKLIEKDYREFNKHHQRRGSQQDST